MSVYEKHYYYSLVFKNIKKFEVEEEVRDFYLPITKNSMEKHQQLFPSLVEVMEPSVKFFDNTEGEGCMTTHYGYKRRIEVSVDVQDEEGQKLWMTILDLLLGFVGIMGKSHEFELYAYGMAFDEREFGWFLYSTGAKVSAEQIYKNFPKEYISF